MKKIILILILLCISYNSFAQNVRWSDVSFSFFKGPVSGISYSYNIIISENSSAKLFIQNQMLPMNMNLKSVKRSEKLNKA